MTLNKTTAGILYALLPKRLYIEKFDFTTLFTEPGNKEVLFITSKDHQGKHWNGFKSAMKEIHSVTGEINFEENVLLIARYL